MQREKECEPCTVKIYQSMCWNTGPPTLTPGKLCNTVRKNKKKRDTEDGRRETATGGGRRGGEWVKVRNTTGSDWQNELRPHALCNREEIKSGEQRFPNFCTWRTLRWTQSQSQAQTRARCFRNLWIYFTYSSGRKNIETIW